MTPPASTTGARSTGRLRVDGADIHYEVCGHGPAIVFAHGLGGSHMSWWQQVTHFAPAYTCVSFAHRGFASGGARRNGRPAARFAGRLSGGQAVKRRSVFPADREARS